MKKLLQWIMVFALLSRIQSFVSIALAQGTAFNYNGQLNSGSSAASGSFDLVFTLFSTNGGGCSVVASVTNSAIDVTNGLFTAAIDFGSNLFTGSNYWLELAVRTNGSGIFTTLMPRQQILPVPYSIYSANAGNAQTANTAVTAGSVLAANISGTMVLTQLPNSIVTNGGFGVNLAGAFAGNGSGLTNLNGYVAKAGDTMNGTLNLPVNGLNVGFSQLVLTNGNIGIGIANPATILDINGPVTTRGAINALGGLVIQNLSTDPTNPVPGQIWLRTN